MAKRLRARVASPEAKPPRRARVLARLERIGARGLAERTASEFGVALGRVLQGKCRSRSVIRARHRIWCLLRHTLDLSYPEMARVFEADHTTIVVAVRKREQALALDAGGAVATTRGRT
jgi:chromosomal replication initiation ATPase DnaA